MNEDPCSSVLYTTTLASTFEDQKWSNYPQSCMADFRMWSLWEMESNLAWAASTFGMHVFSLNNADVFEFVENIEEEKSKCIDISLCMHVMMGRTFMAWMWCFGIHPKWSWLPLGIAPPLGFVDSSSADESPSANIIKVLVPENNYNDVYCMMCGHTMFIV